METKELLSAIGLPETLDSVEAIVAEHGKLYLSKSEAHEDETVKGKITGRIFGELTKEAKNLFGFTNDEIKDKHIKDILKEGVGRFSTKIIELEDLSGKGNEEVVKKLQGDVDKHKGLAKQYKEDLEKVVGEKTEIETSFNQKLKDFKIGSVYNEAIAKLPYSDSANEITKLGFETLIRNSYKFDIGENDEVLILTKEGQKVPNPLKTGTYLGIMDVLSDEGKKAGILKQNNGGAAPVTIVRKTNETSPPAQTRQMHPAAVKNRTA